MERVRVRFAPSPTGPLHIGGARSALFNWLLARKYNGTMVVRIEDTDLERSSPESEKNILDSLRWLGIDWDEGVEKGGPYGPYRQTERVEIYREYAQRLLAEGKAYYCYCTEEELEAERQALLARGEMPRYTGRCLRLTVAEKRRLEAEGRRPALRFRVPPGRVVTVEDLVRGPVRFETDGIGDFVIVKSDGIPTYNFAVVIDDALMKITHVIRGEEHLSNTPRQLLLYEALGFTPPRFAHVSLILGQDRTKMSKRHGATSVEQYRRMGYLPEALINFLALLGWAPEGEKEIFSREELIQEFSLDRVAKNPAVFDLEKLNWLNGYYIRQAPLAKIRELAVPYLREAGYITGQENPAWLDLVVQSVREYLTCLAEITQHVGIYFAPQVPPADEEAANVLRGEQVPQVLTAFSRLVEERDITTVEEAKAVLKDLTRMTRLGGKQVYLPLRVALTGRTRGPELYYILPILGREKLKQRVEAAFAWLGVEKPAP
ncbi:MAG: nondiscriminating glutamyl-tRNA synthetase [Eubacteriales bacterium]|nr:nondiscriminating glutamyl-tRNA synthetase [Eubacteriales bacterium]MDN5364311.1 nondiscriminating glutamyl-tRNA synthetase [Eubacteriales bacterium]